MGAQMSTSSCAIVLPKWDRVRQAPLQECYDGGKYREEQIGRRQALPRNPSVSIESQVHYGAKNAKHEPVKKARFAVEATSSPVHFVKAADQNCRLEEGCSSARRAPSSYNDSSSFPQQSAGYALGVMKSGGSDEGDKLFVLPLTQ